MFSPNAHIAHNNLRTFYGDEGKIDQAISNFRESIASEPLRKEHITILQQLMKKKVD